MNYEVATLLQEMSSIFEEFRAKSRRDDDEVALAALYALGYFAGNIILEAPDQTLRVRAHQIMNEGMADALLIEGATRH